MALDIEIRAVDPADLAVELPIRGSIPIPPVSLGYEDPGGQLEDERKQEERADGEGQAPGQRAAIGHV